MDDRTRAQIGGDRHAPPACRYLDLLADLLLVRRLAPWTGRH